MTDERTASEVDELAALEALHESGDARELDRRARLLAERAQDEDVRKRAIELRKRVQLDPFVLWVWVGTVVFIAGIVYFYVVR
jgi:hypothetical protein